MIIDYTIFGERNSGTNYLRRVMDDNFHLPFTKLYGFKHWFIKDLYPRGRPNTTTDNECLKPLTHGAQTLFLFIVRNPIDWVGSMFKKPYHFKRPDRSSLLNFVSSHYLMSYDRQPQDHLDSSETPWYTDPTTKTYFVEESKNLITLRNEKYDHFYELRNHVRYFSLIRLEHLKEDIQKILDDYPLKSRNSSGLVFNEFRNPGKYELDDATLDFMARSLDNSVDREHYSA